MAIRVEDLAIMCDEAERNTHFGEPILVFRLPRKCRGKTARVFKGVTGTIVEWGDSKENPTVVTVKTKDIRRFIADKQSSNQEDKDA